LVDQLCVLLGGRLGEGETQAFLNIFQQLMSAISYMHGQEIVHGDIKLENLLLDAAGRLRITDFGLSKSLRSQSQLSNRTGGSGTPGYIAPEVANGGKVDYSSDIFSLAIVLCALLTGIFPFEQLTVEVAILFAIAKGERPVLPPGLSPGLTRLLEAMWSGDPSERPNAYIVISLIKGSRNNYEICVPDNMFQKKENSKVSLVHTICFSTML
jgi:eukaryotic-like serine/threonine-protein kinase